MAETARRIDDAGQKIEGARKDWKLRAMGSDDLETMTQEEIVAEVRKDNVWPKPDYAALIEAGMEPTAAAYVKIVRDRMAQEPRERHGHTPVEIRKAFVKMTAMLRDMYVACRSPQDVIDVNRQAQQALGGRIEARGESGLLFFSVYKGRACPMLIGWSEQRKARKMIEEGFPGSVPAWKKGVVARGDRDGTVYLTQGSKILEKGFTDEEAAWAWCRERAKEIKPVAKEKTGPVDPDRPHLDRLERHGLDDWRGGRDVSPDEFIETFGFRGVQFGNWLPDGERQTVLNLGFDACHDLAKALGWDPSQMSLEGTLAIAFGARGKGGKAAAHYEPGQRVVNMTRLSGAGCFAHEFGHALDHWTGTGTRAAVKVPSASGWEEWVDGRKEHLLEHRGAGPAEAWDGVMRDIATSPMDFAERIVIVEANILKIEKNIELNAKGLEQALARDPKQRNARYIKEARKYASQAGANLQSQKWVLEKLQAEPDKSRTAGSKRSSYFDEAIKISGSGDYWKRPNELFARAFEAWVFDELASAGGRSDYLVQGVEEGRYSGPEYKGDAYPAGEERVRIAGRMREMVDALRPLVEPVTRPAPAP